MFEFYDHNFMYWLDTIEKQHEIKIERLKGKLALFLDRDGVLNINTHYPHTEEDLLVNREFTNIFFNRRKSPLEKILKPIVVTNQSGVSRGYYKKEECYEFEKRLAEKIQPGLTLPFYHSWSEDDSDPMRKPNPGMLTQACSDFKINPGFMIGDKPSDVHAGNLAGCIKSYLYKFGKAEDLYSQILKELGAWIQKDSQF